ncbi:NACHT domain-containing protein [Streptomyces purpureus]|uniref:NACHT domain-containing protein n=1 Tax=Streptomyces purpureus TaxID=1951 RepID=UPI00039FFD7B|nr:NACHT domain-containing protein [Streptomyces purpureus]
MVGTAAVVGATVWVASHLKAGQSATDVATLVGVPIGLTGLVVALISLRATLATLGQPADAAAAARSAATTLAGQIRAAEAEQWKRLVGGEVERINLHYSLHANADPAAALAPTPAGRLYTKPDGAAGAPLPDITAFYRGTRPARLVVTGAPGAGKTVLALELILGLLKSRADTDPVPVRLSLAEWDTHALPRLKDFVADHLVHALDWHPKRARQLIDHGMVLPVLDGLDEMDTTLSHAGTALLDADGHPLPDPAAPRARAALDRLNAYQDATDRGPLVVTCRSAHYDALPEEDRLRTAAEIRVDAVGREDAAAYLERRSAGSARWRPLLRHLRTDPAGTLAQSLSTPWRLSLTAVVYRRHGDPGELLQHATPADLDDHLLARLIPAATDLAPNPRGYTAQRVHRWLAHLNKATLPDPATAGPGAAMGTDLVLHRLWPLEGRRDVRIMDGLMTMLVLMGPMLALRIALTPDTFWHLTMDIKIPHLATRVLVFTALAAFAVAWGRSGPATESPRRTSWKRLRTAEGLGQVLIGLLVGAAGGAFVGVLSVLADALNGDLELSLRTTLLVGIVPGTVCGALLALGAELSQSPSEMSGPRDLIRDDTRNALAVALPYGVGLGVLSTAFHGAAVGVCLGAAALVGLALAVGAASRRYAVFLFCAAPRLPLRLGEFMDWACEAGLLRLSGPAYQFRHRELQAWLARNPSPPPP